MTDETPSQRTARTLGISENELAASLTAFSESGFERIVITSQTARLEDQIEQRQRKLENVEPDKLRKVQGEIAGLRLAIGLLDLK